jgi:shikimate kinase/3-dehydroquinate synthase
VAPRWLIVGSTAAGKSTAGRALAARCALPFGDADPLLEKELGMGLQQAYEQLGEEAVRSHEAALVTRLLAERDGVLALGGGSFASPGVRAAAKEQGWVALYLRLQPSEAAARLATDPVARPGCDGPNATLALLSRRFAARDEIYATADVVVDCDGLSPVQVVDRVAAAFGAEPAPHPVAWLEGGPSALADMMREAVPSGRLLVVADRKLQGAVEATVSELAARGRVARVVWVEGGEAAKTVSALSGIWTEAFAGPLDRGDTVVTVGGGVVSDLGGFAAATLMRGLPVVHVATTLMGMVDAALGGKTGVDLPAGKNLVGAFHMPSAVIQWGASLATLPDRDFASGLAEVVKCALLSGERALAQLEADAPALCEREAAAVGRAVALATQTKMALVARDPQERGDRALLNLGHTIGHALEAVTGYERYLHGEAVAIGLVAALRFGSALGETEPGLAARVAALLTRLGLPTELPDLPPEIWREALSRDKKRTDDAVRFVLCRRAGQCALKIVELDRVDAWIRRSLSGSMVDV